MKKIFLDWTVFEKSWLFIFSILGVCLSLHWGESPVGIISFLTGIWCVVLVLKGKISNYYFGLINVIAYGYIAYNRELYGEVMLNWGYYLPAQTIGLYLWLKSENRLLNNKSIVKVKSLSFNKRIILLCSGLVSIAMYGFMLKVIKGNLPWLDASTTMLQVIAMVLMVFRYKEQWILWVVVNIISIYMWSLVLFRQGGNDISALIMWIAYLVNSIYGYYKWNQMEK